MKRFSKLTVIDLGVVVMICLFIAALLVPVTGHARDHTRDLVCLLNVRGVSQAWTLYHEDYDGFLVGGSTYNSTEYRWAERPLVEGEPMPIPEGVNPADYQMPYGEFDFDSRMRGIRAGQLFTYTENEKLYHCPNDRNIIEHEEPFAVYRTYSISGLMNGEDRYERKVTWPDGEVKTLLNARKATDIKSPSEKYVFVEEDVVNSSLHSMQMYNLGGFVLMSGNNYWSWYDMPDYFHDGFGVLGFSDGHAEKHTWQDPQTIALMTHERGEPGQPPNNQPNNPDIVYMNRGYLACD